MLYAPALPPACSRINAIALLVSVDASFEAPCNGKSEEMISVPPAAGADVPPAAVVPLGAVVPAGAVVAPGAAVTAGAPVSLALFVSDPQATPTTASAIKSADAFLNLMVLPFVGILVSPPRNARGTSQLGSPPMRPTVRFEYESHAHHNSQRLLVASNPRQAGRGSEVDDLVGNANQFLVVTGANDACATVGAVPDRTGY